MGLIYCYLNTNNDQKAEKVLSSQSDNSNTEIVDSLTLRLPANQIDISYDNYSEL